MRLPVPEYIASLIPYPPGKPLEELEREYGISDSIKLASNENPLGPSPKALAAIGEAMKGLHRYPDGSGYYLRKRLSEKFGIPFDGIVLGNGSNEIIELLIRTYLLPDEEVVLPAPSFLVYRLAVQARGGKGVSIPLNRYRIDLKATLEAITPKTRIIFINNPNNPTGTVVGRSEFESFLKDVPPEVIVVLDEAYREFVRDEETPDGFNFIRRVDTPVVVLRTFSKLYGLAGLRIGYGAMHPAVADYINRVRQPFNTGSLAQIGALAALDDEEFVERSRNIVWEGLSYLYAGIERLGLSYLPTQTNFFLVEVPSDARQIYEAMLRKGVIIRAMNAYGLNRHIRVNVGLPEENARFLAALQETLAEIR